MLLNVEQRLLVLLHEVVGMVFLNEKISLLSLITYVELIPDVIRILGRTILISLIFLILILLVNIFYGQLRFFLSHYF